MTKIQYYFMGLAWQSICLSTVLYFNKTVVLTAFSLFMLGLVNIGIVLILSILKLYWFQERKP